MLLPAQVYQVLEPVLLEKNKAEERLKVGAARAACWISAIQANPPPAVLCLDLGWGCAESGWLCLWVSSILLLSLAACC
jgi:hypothetical protein